MHAAVFKLEHEGKLVAQIACERTTPKWNQTKSTPISLTRIYR
jgi:hypothetical protein